ncbi:MULTISPECIES: cupin domain-containing protein [unclassified Acidisoma]|jgi:mannose-6-phosphate isomerase-like protein (cupin superfamily)|uniref:cupin domain-containing protein n=1 Tax=unclassified Acidisoma TaxID=2634065 RepID=UPI00131AE520|nr:MULTISPECIES: cupin domain-containing protein [unclassified Acidisoma]
MKTSLADLVGRLPGPVTPTWPGGEPFTVGMRHGSMSVEVFAPRGTDFQGPHEQDELYFVVSGSAEFEHGGGITPTAQGDVLFVAAGETHCFHRMSEDFVTWVVFWGPTGGEATG